MIVGLTGGIGVGKSTVAAELSKLGAYVIDVDIVCRDAIEPGGLAHDALLARFGDEIVRDGAVDRATLARQVFADAEAMADLVGLSHPAANQMMSASIAELAPDIPVVLDMAILTEYPKLGRWGTGPDGGYQSVLLVTAPESDRMDRLARQRGMAPADAHARIAAQATDDQRRAIADVEIVNDGDLDSLVRKVAAAWRQIGSGETCR